MNKEYDNYINKIVSNIGLSGKKARRVREDLYSSLIEKQQITGETNPYILMGDPEDIAEEFRENIGMESEIYLEYKSKLNILGVHHYWYEYKSKVSIMGIPLLHINCKPMGVAKGIVSIGSIAIGVLAFGGVSIGAISFGAIAIGILAAIGGISLAGLFSIGGIAIAFGVSIGGVAISKLMACGGYASANIAIGGISKGVISIFKQSGEGKYLFDNSSNLKEIINTIREVYPNISEKIINIMEKFISLFLIS